MCTVFFSNRSLKVGRQFSIWWVIYIELAFKNSRINNCNTSEIDFFFKKNFYNSFSLSLQKNIEPIHLIDENTYACPFCVRTMRDKGHMKQHILIHTGEKPFVCPYCTFACNIKSNWRRHIRKQHACSPPPIWIRESKFKDRNGSSRNFFKKEMKYMMICFSIEKKIGYFFCPFDFLLFSQENFNFYLYLP